MARPLTAHGNGDAPGAWRTVALLSLLYAFSSIDRLILSLLVAPIKAEFGASDTQIGILFGLSFALLYTLAGLPIARIADHGNRRRLVVVGVVVWSGSTALSALCHDFATLLLCRAGVAIGEAALTPAAISLIADLFARGRRGRATAAFVATGTVVGLSGALIGGAMLALATRLSPSVGGLAPWRLTLALVGGAGIVAAAIFALLVHEPPRGEEAVAAPSPRTSAHLVRHRGFYVPLFAAVGMSVVISYAMIGWMPTLLMRRFGLDAPVSGYLFGALGISFGLAGTLGTPWLAERLRRRTGRDGLLPVGIGLSLVALPAVVLAMLADRLILVAGALAVALAALPGLTLLPSLAIQQSTPPPQRGQAVALYLLIANLLGLGCGPTLAGLLSDTLMRDHGGMASALALLGAVSLMLCIALLLSARAPYRRLLDGG